MGAHYAVGMNPTQLAIAAMTDEERAEYRRLKGGVGQHRFSITAKIYAGTGVAVIAATVGVVLSIAATQGTGAWPTFWFVIWVVSFFGGLLAAAIADTVVKRRSRRRAELLAAAAARLPDPRTHRGGVPAGARDDGTDWRRFPVTGVYDPATYRERGGRSTARAMQAWGDIDYQTYRSNID